METNPEHLVPVKNSQSDSSNEGPNFSHSSDNQYSDPIGDQVNKGFGGGAHE